MTQMITRSFEVRDVDTDARTITGIAVPWDVDTNVGDYVERFERGAFGDIADVKLFYGHDFPIGAVVRGEDTDEGFLIEARISKTPKGDEVYTLMQDNVLNRFSVGFIPVEDRMDDDVVVRTQATLKEVSVVPFPAYEGAAVLAVRNDDRSTNSAVDTTAENTNEMKVDRLSEINYAVASDVEDLRSAIDEMNRRLVAGGTDNDDNKATQFRSGGDFLKALHANDDAAKNQVRAYTGATLADSHVNAAWQNDLLKVVERGRPVVNLFTKGTLPAEGMTISYPYLGAVTGDVAKQVAEGDDLAYIEVDIQNATVNVDTYGGYSQLSRQAIERSSVAYLEAVLKIQAQSYAKVTNAKVRSTMVAATPQTGTSFTLSSATAGAFLGAVVDGVAKIDANAGGTQAEFVLVSLDVYSKLASLEGGPLAFDMNGSNGATIGSTNVRAMSGTIAGLPIVVDAGLANKSFYVANSSAVTVWENAGAPLRLQDENIINLTKDFSLYGYLAVGVTNANGLVKATVA